MFSAAPHHDVLHVLIQIAVLLLTARLMGEAATRIGLPAVVGEISGGILLGPSFLSGLFPSIGAWLIPQNATQGHLLEFVSLLGVMFLLVFTGMEIDSRLIRRHAGSAMSVAVGGLLFPLAAGFLLGLLLPESLLSDPARRGVFALFLATAMSISAIPVLAKVLMDLGMMRHRLGQSIIVAAMIDDTVGWVLLSIVAALAAESVVTPGRIMGSVGLVAGFLALSFTLGRWLIGRAQRIVMTGLRVRHREVSLVALFMLVWGALSQGAGLEPLFGAFIVGVVFSQVHLERDAPDVPKILDGLVIGIFAPVFFGVTGLKVNLLTLFQKPDLLLAGLLVILVATACKVIGVYAGARLLGRLDHWTALFYGAGLNARGSMEIIVASIGMSLGILTAEMFSIIVVMAVVTSIMAPVMLRMIMARLPQEALAPEAHVS